MRPIGHTLAKKISILSVTALSAVSLTACASNYAAEGAAAGAAAGGCASRLAIAVSKRSRQAAMSSGWKFSSCSCIQQSKAT